MKTYKILENENGVIKPSPKTNSLVQGTSIKFESETGHTLIFNKTEDCGVELVAVVPSGFVVIDTDLNKDCLYYASIDQKPILKSRPINKDEYHPEI